jgi:hypothetical protein
MLPPERQRFNIMKPIESATGHSWRLLAEHNRVIAAYTARLDRKTTLLRAADDYDARAAREDERAAGRRTHASTRKFTALS